MKILKTILQSNYFYYFLFFLIIFFTLFRINAFKPEKLIEADTYLVFVNEYEIDGDYLKIEGNVHNTKVIAKYYIDTYKEQQYLKNNIKYGTVLEIIGELTLQNNNTIPNGFNYKEYLENNGVSNTILVEKIKVKRQSENIFYIIKNKAYERTKLFKEPSYIYAFVLGNTNYLDNEVNKIYLENGITHLFSLSGLHVSIFALIIINILKAFKIGEFKRIFIVFMVLLLFTFITGYSPSIIRATILFFLIALNKYFKLNVKTENILILTFFISLLLKPNDIYNVGFQLSYIVTYFLIISNFLLKNKSKIKILLLISIISLISSLPIIINLNSEVNLFSIFNNIIFVPFVTYIVFPLALITYSTPFIQEIFYFFIDIMEYLTVLLNNFKMMIVIKYISLIFVLIYYIFLFLLFKTKQFKFLFFNFILILIIKFSNVIDKNTYFYFLDVGQGDSMFILTENKKSIIIDTGGKITYKKENWAVRNSSYSICEDTLVPFYKSLGINKIDYMFITHGDVDHAKEAKCIEQSMNVKQSFINSDEVTEYEKLYNYKKFGNSFIKIDNVKIYNINDNLYDNENDNSLVLLIEINDLKFLLMGDAGVLVEKNLMDRYNLKEIDILKVGHHGSKSSSSKEFIDEVNPKYSIISVGKNNRYGHPNNEVLENLKDSKIYRTDRDGSIMFMIKNNKLKIETCSS